MAGSFSLFSPLMLQKQQFNHVLVNMTQGPRITTGLVETTAGSDTERAGKVLTLRFISPLSVRIFSAFSGG